MITHIPKGSMCIGCVYIYKDCSYLNFKKMYSIENNISINTNIYTIVKCNIYMKNRRIFK